MSQGNSRFNLLRNLHTVLPSPQLMTHTQLLNHHLAHCRCPGSSSQGLVHAFGTEFVREGQFGCQRSTDKLLAMDILRRSYQYL